MKINNSDYSKHINKIYTQNQENIQNKKINQKSKNDKIEISESSKILTKKINDPKIQSDIPKRVEKIREALLEGTYHISSEKIADKMIKIISEQKKEGNK